MKSFVKFITESKGQSELISAIKKADTYDMVPYLWAVMESASKPSDSGVFNVECVIHLEKRPNGKFLPISNMFFGGSELIDKACKEKGWHKLRRFFDFGLLLSEEEVIELIDILPKYFDEDISGKGYVKAVSFDFDLMYSTCAKMSKPYKIKSLEDEIKSIEANIKSLDEKKSQLEKLKNAKDEE